MKQEEQTVAQSRVKYLLALRAVMMLHIDIHYVNGPLKTKSMCEHCETEWPCETMKVVHLYIR